MRDSSTGTIAINNDTGTERSEADPRSPDRPDDVPGSTGGTTSPTGDHATAPAYRCPRRVCACIP